jgi:polyketide synthase 5
MVTFSAIGRDAQRPTNSLPSVGSTSTVPVAVVGMACRLPGGIDSPELLWDALLRGDDLITDVPRDRWDADAYYDQEPGLHGRSVGRWGAFLDDVAGFDCDFFGIDEDEARALDPQHRLLLESSWEVVEHAGLVHEQIAGSLTGVFVGLTHLDYQLMAAQSHTMAGPYGFQGNALGMASGRIARALRVHGPAITVDTACSSGLLAAHMAARSLNDGESDLAIAGGAHVMLDPRKFAAASAQSLLSPTGRCRAFDAAADGFVSGEGVATVLLKRLPDAVRDGDRILAVVRGSAANQDGHVDRLGTPSRQAQTAVYRKALAAAGVDPRTVGMVEAHGPGTPTGDAVEYASLAEIYGTGGPCALTSVKTNFGHTQSAAGVLGLMKAVLAVQHGVIPQNLHFTGLPDELSRIGTKLFVPHTHSPLPISGAASRRAAVSAYGLSGTNVHCIVEQAPPPATVPPVTGPSPLLFPLSATSAEELRRTAGRLAAWVRAHDEVPLSDLAYTLARRRTHRPVRASVVASSALDLAEALDGIASDTKNHSAASEFDNRRPVWVFSDEGSQWSGMGAELLVTEPVFAATVARAEPVILRECGFSVTEAMSAREQPIATDRIQPTLCTLQIALAATLSAHGARPGAVIGHSMGEVSAAVVAGALSLEDGLTVACRRATLLTRLSGTGATASVELPAQQVLSELTLRGKNDVVVAAVPSPESTVIAGTADTVREFVAAWRDRGVAARELSTDVATHSPLVDPIVGELTESLASLSPTAPDLPFYSTTSFDPRDEPECDARYWASNVRRMVRFSAAVRAAIEDGHRVFVELSPEPLLTGAVEQTAARLDTSLVTLAGMRRDQERPDGLWGLVGELHRAGATIDFAVPHPVGTLVDAPLPSWTHRRLWFDADGTPPPADHVVAVHPLLGPHVRLQEEPERHVWQCEVGTDAHPWLTDHQIHAVATLPVGVYGEMALAAARGVLGEASEVRDVSFEQSLVVDRQTTVGAVASAEAPGALEFSVHTLRHGDQIRHAAAVLHAVDDAAVSTPPRDVPGLLAAHPHRIDGSEIRDRLSGRGIGYGSAFASLVAVHTGDTASGTVVAEIAATGPIRAQQNAFGVHPALLDACLQAVTALPEFEGLLALPTGIRRLRAHRSARGARYCYARSTGALTADVEILDQHGDLLIDVEGVRFAASDVEADRADALHSERLLTIDWLPQELSDPPNADAGTWLLVGCPALDPLATDLSEALQARGARCLAIDWPSDHSGLEAQLRGELTGVVVLAGPAADAPDEGALLRGREYVQRLAHIARTLAQMPGDPAQLHLVTRTAQTVLPGERPHLEQGGLRGLLRVIGNEHPHLGATHVDVDDADGVAEQLARQFLGGLVEDETAWRNGRWYAARLRSVPLRPEERHTAVADAARDGVRMQVRTPGDLESLEAVPCKRVSPTAGRIEVAVRAASLNFDDVQAAVGHPAGEGTPQFLGTDFAGVVTSVGPGVMGLHVGDRVGGLSPEGSWGTFLTCDASRVVALPADLADDDAAAVTTSHATAYYGLHDLAHLAAGEKVLIHSATGGVGMAAIAIARAAGAEVFATAGSAARRDLLRTMGIEHVYDSRSLDFATLIRRDTNDYGVDVVLNSVTGAAQRASLELLSFGGRFVEIGKRDPQGDTRLGPAPFRRNLTFYAVDLGLLANADPGRLRRVLTTVYGLVAGGSLPRPACTHYALGDAADALRSMSGAEHVGKLVLDVPATGSIPTVVPPALVEVFRPDGAYVVTEGLGGHGVFLAERMAAAGVGRIVLCSPRPPTPEALEQIAAMRLTHTEVVVECGDVADPETARRLIATATATGLPVRGVLHAAAAADVTDEVVEHHWGATAYGAWHLHTATLGHALDWFCCFSSAAALVGSPGQGAHAAANGWLDAFARWRRAQGLPANAIAWGGWDRTGAHGVDAITDAEGALAFETLLRHDRTYSGYAALAGTPWLSAFAQRVPFARELRQETGGTGRLRAELDDLPVEQWPLRLRQMLSDQVSVVVRRTIDPDRPLPECGIDSLGALELCTRVEAETGVRLRVTEITTIRGLADLLCERLTPAGVA